MQRHARVHARNAVAATTALGIAIGLCAAITNPAAAVPAGATADDEVVVPNPGRFQPRGEELFQAGATGYAHKQEGTTGYLWTDAATGATKPITEEQAKGHSGLHAFSDADPVVADLDRVSVTDLATGQPSLQVTLPQGRSWTGAYNADTVVSSTRRADGLYLDAIQLYGVVDGKPVERAAVKMPEMFAEVIVLAQDSKGAHLRFNREPGQSNSDYLLDFRTGSFKHVSGGEGIGLTMGSEQVLVSSHWDKTLSMAPRTDPMADVDLPAPKYEEGTAYTVVGDWVVFTKRTVDGFGGKLQAVRKGTTAVKDLLPHATAHFAAAPDGSLLVTGGSDAKDWSVQRVAVGPDGDLQVSKVRAVPQVPAAFTGLALGGGRLSFRGASLPANTSGLYDVDTSVSGTPTASEATLRHDTGTAPAGLASLGDGESVYSTGSRLRTTTGTGTYRSADVPASASGHRILDTSGGSALVAAGDTTYAVDLEGTAQDQPGVRLTLRNSAAALWKDRVWKPADTTGKVNSVSIRGTEPSPAVDLGSGCEPTELQAVGNWLYWACGADKAGVYDHSLKKSVPVPTGEALLGDGFVVRHEGDKLRLTDAASGRTTDFADLPASASGSGRRSTWTVDRFGGGVAYVDAKHDIRVKQVGIARQPFQALGESVPPVTFEGSAMEPTATWSPSWRFSKPVGSWKLSLLKSDGEAVRVFEGTQGTGAAVRVNWDGKDARGRTLESGSYRWELIARPQDGAGSTQTPYGNFWIKGSTLTTVPGTYTPVTPARLMDTREGLGVPKAKVTPGSTVKLKVGGVAGVPAENLTAVVLNVTATNPTATSFVSVYPYGTQRTSASNLNFKAGQTVPNLVTVPVVNGWVEFYNRSGTVDLLADVAGYYTEGTSGAEYQPVTPSRLMDTRTGTGVPKAKVGAGKTVTLTIREPGVTAVAMNVTATNATSSSFVSVYPYGTTRTAASNLNFTAGQTVPNVVIVPVKDGKITFYNKNGSVDLIADVAGYFKDSTGSVFTGMQPKRLMDTRDGTGVPKAKVGEGRTVSLTVGTKYKALVLNVTATNATESSFVSVYPYGTTRTAASNLNFTAGQTVPNLVVVPVNDGKITFYNKNGSVDLIADVAGYYTD
ncbi:hypothetical protein ACWDX6_21195 [Streptomyces sp. NPDC003027]